MSKNQITGTATQPQPQRNRKFCQSNNDQYCTSNMLCLLCTAHLDSVVTYTNHVVFNAFGTS